MVIGPHWLLEMVRLESRNKTRGFFWAPFSIVHHLPELDDIWNGHFVGFSTAGNPPATWLNVSLTCDLGDIPLARSPEEFVARFAKPVPFTPLEGRKPVSDLSREAKKL